MTTAPAKAPKKHRINAYLATVKIAMPLDMENAESLSEAMKAVAAIKDGLGADARCEIQGTLGKI